MMNLEIFLKSGEQILIEDFKELNYVVDGSHKKIKDDFSKLSIHNGITYNFMGTSQFSIKGSEISHLKLVKVEHKS